jgi:transcriptional regulator with XRE-family HTH domain
VETIVSWTCKCKSKYGGWVNDAPVDKFLTALMEEIRKERIAQGLNYEDLAAATGLHRTTFSLYDRGERGPSFEVLAQIAQALGLSLSELIRRAESQVFTEKINEDFAAKREVSVGNFRNAQALREITGLSSDALRHAIRDCYRTLDTIDAQLAIHSAEPISKLVELANLSSMVGNLLAAGIADASNGLYKRNGPHKHPDLLSQSPGQDGLEIKVALESNKPKGHQPKPGTYITFRYVLCGDDGLYLRGKEQRGSRMFIWEVKVGVLRKEDFSLSNTEGDSGKTAVVKTDIFNGMSLVYYDPDLLPYGSRDGKYPGYN